MVASATVRVMSPEEIAARAGGQTAFILFPQRSTLFAERAMRLRQLSRGHVMAEFLVFMADLAQAQHTQLQRWPGTASVPLPDGAALDQAAGRGQPPLPAADWPRDPAWHGLLRDLVAGLRPQAPAGALPTLDHLAAADAVFLERQADALLTGVMAGLDLGCAPIVGAALQVYWTHLVQQVRHAHGDTGEPFGRIDDETVCPCCGSLPTASITRSAGESLGQRYLHCALCSTQWHMVRIKCTHCLSTRALAYQSLAAAGEDDDEADSSRAAQAALQAETCEDCGHYLKIMHSDRDPFVEPAADDLASLTLDLLVAETGLIRHGLNYMLLFGESDSDEPDRSDGRPPDPGGP